MLGTFAIYSDRVREPTSDETRLIDVATKIVGIAIERKLAEERIQFMATHDALTGVLSRASLKETLAQALRLAERRDRWAAVVFVDLDNFKYVNDSLGHNVGDDLLRTIAKRLIACVRATDAVVRIGGDEFVLVLGDQEKTVEAISAVARRTQAAIAEPIAVEGHNLRMTGSIGVAIYPNDGGQCGRPHRQRRRRDVSREGKRPQQFSVFPPRDQPRHPGEVHAARGAAGRGRTR